jgi:LEA14-like dessication related protein
MRTSIRSEVLFSLSVLIFLIVFIFNLILTNTTTLSITASEDIGGEIIQPNQTNTTTLSTAASEDIGGEIIQPNQTNTTTLSTAASEDIGGEIIQPNKPELRISTTFAKDPIIAGEKQILTINVKDSLSEEDLEGVVIDGNVTFYNKKLFLGKGETNKKGKILYTIPISFSALTKISPATVFVNAYKYKYDNQTEMKQFKISPYSKLFSLLFNKIELGNKIEGEGSVPIKLLIEVINKSYLPIVITRLSSTLSIDEIPYTNFDIIKTNKSSLNIPANSKQAIPPYKIQLIKSKVDEYIYRQLSLNPTESHIFEYRLNGNMYLTFNNKNITVQYNDLAEHLRYNNTDYNTTPLIKN